MYLLIFKVVVFYQLPGCTAEILFTILCKVRLRVKHEFCHQFFHRCAGMHCFIQYFKVLLFHNPAFGCNSEYGLEFGKKTASS